MANSTVSEPFPITLTSGRYMVYDVQTIAHVQRNHGIEGASQALQQYNPLELRSEDVALLVNKGAAQIIRDDKSKPPQSPSTAPVSPNGIPKIATASDNTQDNWNDIPEDILATAALALRKQGHEVTVLERSRFAVETGAAMHMAPNATALLEWMDVRPSEVGGTLLRQMRRFDANGNLLHTKEFGPEDRSRWQTEWYLVHRVDLHNKLKSEATSTTRAGVPVQLHLACKVTDIDLYNASVTLEDGRTFNGDLLLGADGLHSFTRKQMVGEVQPYAVGKSCMRWLVSKETLLADPRTDRASIETPGAFVEWSAPDRRLVAYPCGDDKIMNMCAFAPSSEFQDPENTTVDEYNTSGNMSLMLRAFKNFCPAVQAAMENSGDSLKIWDMYDMKTLPKWCEGSTAIIGDAAHPFQPYMGQGGAMAIEDAVSVAVLLPLGTSKQQIPERLRLYEKCRKQRNETVLMYTRMNGRDEGDDSVKRMTAKDLVDCMTLCVMHNERNSSMEALSKAIAV